MFCPNCGYENVWGAGFCENCGYVLSAMYENQDPNGYGYSNDYIDPNGYVDSNAYADPNEYMYQYDYQNENAYEGYGNNGSNKSIVEKLKGLKNFKNIKNLKGIKNVKIKNPIFVVAVVALCLIASAVAKSKIVDSIISDANILGNSSSQEKSTSTGIKAFVQTESSELMGGELQGDLVIYTKEIGEEVHTYYTNCEDIGETELIDADISNLYVDKNRKSIIFEAKSGLYIKPIKADTESIKIGDVGNGRIVNNKYVVYDDSERLFVYDLDSKKKTVVGENIYTWDYNGCYGPDETISYIEFDSDKHRKFCTYNLKSKKRDEVSLAEGYVKGCWPSKEAVFYIVEDRENNVPKKQTLYKSEIGKKTEIIDEIDVEVFKYEDSEGNNNLFFSYMRIFGLTSNKSLYYYRIVDLEKTSSDSYHIKANCYFYDGKLSKILDNISNIRNGGTPALLYNHFAFEYEALSNDGSSKVGFVVGDDIHEGRLDGMSVDGNNLVYTKNEDGKNVSYKYNIKTGVSEKLENDVNELVWFDDKNLFYLTKNRDAVLNDEIVDYKLTKNLSSSDLFDVNEDFSIITYETNSGLSIYKNGETNIISSKATTGGLTFNGNVYYIKDDNLYLYSDGESKLIASDVEGCIRYQAMDLVYKALW